MKALRVKLSAPGTASPAVAIYGWRIATFLRAAGDLKVSTLPGQRVVDPFAGSGSTAIAALRNGRAFSGCEIDPRHADIAVQRLTAEEMAIR